jgi:hypothetical protein
LLPVAIVMPHVAFVVPRRRTARCRRCAAHCSADPCRRCVVRHRRRAIRRRSAPCRHCAARHCRAACVVMSPVASSCHTYSKKY